MLPSASSDSINEPKADDGDVMIVCFCLCSGGLPVILFPSLSSLQSEEQAHDSHLPAAREDAAGQKLKLAEK